jgi:hypothetical protein
MDLCVENRALKRICGRNTPEVPDRCENLHIEELYNFHSSSDNIRVLKENEAIRTCVMHRTDKNCVQNIYRKTQ